jgi:multidrug efflux pump subunit AcrA (membrane-fusion protein)
MKDFLLILLSFVTIASCTNKAADEQLAEEKALDMFAATRAVGVCKIIPEGDIIQLSSPVNGIVQKIYKAENDIVSIGSVILELDHALEDAKLIQLVNQVNTQTEQIKIDEANVEGAQAKYINAKSELTRLQNLLAKGAETQQSVDDASTNLKSLSADLARLKANVGVSKSKLLETKAVLQIAQIEREQKIIKSPVDGQVLELSVLIGGSVAPNEAFGQIRPEGKTISICEIDELNASKIAIGQKGWIRNVGSTDTLSTGIVYFASSFLKKKSLFTDQSGEKEDRRVRTIKIILDTPDGLLLNERVECVIDISGNLKK